MNAGEYVEAMEKVADVVGKGAQVRGKREQGTRSMSIVSSRIRSWYHLRWRIRVQLLQSYDMPKGHPQEEATDRMIMEQLRISPLKCPSSYQKALSESCDILSCFNRCWKIILLRPNLLFHPLNLCKIQSSKKPVVRRK